jgi:hypothetical protein
MAQPNIEYQGGPFSGQEDYRPNLPATLPGQATPSGKYVRTRKVNRGHIVYEWVPDSRPSAPG